MKKPAAESVNHPSVITLMADTEENVTVSGGRYLILDLNGYMLQGRKNEQGDAVDSVVRNAGTLTITDRNKTTVIRRWAPDTDGMWVQDNSATGTKNTDYFETMGGVITGDRAACGGGVYNTGKLTILGGGIVGNASKTDAQSIGGGGIGNEGTLNISGGTVSGNTAGAYLVFGGGIFNSNEGNVTVSGGSISYNRAVNGGGVSNYGTMTMSGGSVSYNAADYGHANDEGAGIQNSGVLTVSGGTISHNVSDRKGGGVSNGYTMTVSGGTISDNSAKWGGGIWNFDNLNYDQQKDPKKKLTMTGGSIICNTASVSGSGIYQDSVLEIGGKAVIRQNEKTNGMAENLYCYEPTVILSSKVPLEKGADIGVTTAITPTDGNPVVFTAGSDAGDSLPFFTVDQYSYEVSRYGSQLALFVGRGITFTSDEPFSVFIPSLGNSTQAGWTSGTLEFSVDDGEIWTNVTNSTIASRDNATGYRIDSGVGCEILVRGTGITKVTGAESQLHWDVVPSNDSLVTVSGNIMRLLSCASPQTGMTSANSYCFSYLFASCDKLDSRLALPASTLADYCYLGMFEQCESLTRVPELSAENLAKGCYARMFLQCTAVTEAPELPAETLTDECYSSMFSGCAALTEAPELPAKEMKKNCYSEMFSNCTELERIPALSPTVLAESCFSKMFLGCHVVVTEVNEDALWTFPDSGADKWNEDMVADAAIGSPASVATGKSYQVTPAPVSVNFGAETKYYADLRHGIEGAVEGVSGIGNARTVTIRTDYTEGSAASVSTGQFVILDLNGKILSSAAALSGTALISNSGTMIIRDNGYSVHKWAVDPNGKWILNDSAAGTVGEDHYETVGGAITGNVGSTLVMNNGALTVESGNFVGNTGTSGAVICHNGTKLALQGGVFKGNLSDLGAVDIKADGFSVGGNTVINHNFALNGTDTKNLVLESGKLLTQDNRNSGMYIGVTLVSGPYSGAFSTNGNAADTKLYFSDSPVYQVKFDTVLKLSAFTFDTILKTTASVNLAKADMTAAHAKLIMADDGGHTDGIVVYAVSNGAYSYLEYKSSAWKAASSTLSITELRQKTGYVIGEIVDHVHNWSYSASGATLTAICSNADTGHYGSLSETVTLVKPLHTVVGDGQSAAATIQDGKTALGGIATLTSIQYLKKNTSGGYESVGTTAPEKAGSYCATLTVDTNKTAVVEYSIQKRGPAEAPNANNPTVTFTTVTMDENTAWEYSLDGTNWQSSPVFANLTPAACYTVFVRVAETEDDLPSKSAEFEVQTSYAKPEEGEGYTLRLTKCTVWEGYELVRQGDDWANALTAADGTVTLEKERVYCVRYVGDGSFAPSDYTSFVLVGEQPFSGATLTFANTDLKPYTVLIGTVVDLSDFVPVKKGYTFLGWYSDAALTDPVGTVTMWEDVTVYARWKENDKCPGDESCVAAKYIDLNLSMWYHDGIHYSVEKGLMNGMSANTFAPDGTVNRAMVVVMLWRMEGKPSARACSFTDVKADDWFYEAVCWATENGIVEGTSKTTFAPNAPMTREQLATVLYRYACTKVVCVPVRASLNAFTDADKVSNWATAAMQWAISEGLINGRTATTLAPVGTATRAELAVLMMRFCIFLGK